MPAAVRNDGCHLPTSTLCSPFQSSSNYSGPSTLATSLTGPSPALSSPPSSLFFNTSTSGSSPTLPASSSFVTTTSSPSQTSTTASSQSPSSSPIADVTTSRSNAGTIAGSVIGGVIFLVLVLLALLLYLRARKRNRTPPSSEFMNSLRPGAPPVLRLDSGAEYSPALPEKGGAYMHYPPVPLPFQQNSYYASPPMQDMKFPDEMMLSEIPSRRPSVEKPLQPQRYSAQPSAGDTLVNHQQSSSVGSRRELWGRDVEAVSRAASPARLSPAPRESVLHFAPRFSLDEVPSHVSHSPPPLQPLRRRPDSEGT